MNATWANLVSGGGGAVIGAAASMIAAFWTVKTQKKEKKKEEEEKFKSTIRAIRAEFVVVYDIYKKVIGDHIDNGFDRINSRTVVRISKDYFPIYKGNSIEIGRIEDKKHQSNIIKAYTCACSQMEMMEILNDLVSDISALDLNSVAGNNKLYKLKEEGIKNHWIEIKVYHDELKQAFEQALLSMDYISQ